MPRKFSRNKSYTGGNVRIRGGRVLNKHLAAIVCRCAECLAPVKLHNSGVACAEHPTTHKGLIHRNDAAQEAEDRQEQMAEVEANYVIRDGQLVALDDHTERN